MQLRRSFVEGRSPPGPSRGPRRSGFILLLLFSAFLLVSCKQITDFLGIVPATPSGLAVGNQTETNLDVSWAEVGNASSYRVYRDTTANGSGSVKAYEGSAASFTDSGLTSATSYFYRVQSLNGNGIGSPLSAAASGTTKAAAVSAPSVPTGLSIANATSNSIEIAWNASVGATSYRLYRDVSSNGAFSTNVYEGAATSFTDTNLASSTAYFYRVQAGNSAGFSALSSAISGTTFAAGSTPPAIPPGLGVGNPTVTSLDVSWSPSAEATSYEVYRDSTDAGSFATLAFSGAGTSFTNAGLASGGTYFYKVRAGNAFGWSSLSAAVSGTVTISDIMAIPGTGSITYAVDTKSTAKDVYFVFSNVDTNDATSQPLVNGASVAGTMSRSSTPPQPLSLHGAALRDRPGIDPLRMNPFNASPPVRGPRTLILPPRPQFDTVGATKNFMDDSTVNLIPATCRKVVASVPVEHGNPRTLNIWVANDSWTPGGTKANLVTQAMVDALADRFLKGPATADDIYDWVTNVFGEEYGANGYSNLIAPDDAITILLFDISNDNSTNGGVIGYYWAKDQFTTASIPYSNQRVMFYIDSVMFATPDGGTWHVTDYWPSEIFSAQAHEFQHMIHFYQKTVLLSGGAWSDTWLNEMCSMATEDLVADKIGVDGPRGVAFNDGTAGSPGNLYGRLPLYDAWDSIALTDWLGGSDVLKSYSINYAFGAFLSRNFGGARLFHDIVHNDKVDTQAVVSALSAGGYAETFSSVLQKWGVANLLSDRTAAPVGYRYNKGAYFSSTTGSTTYNLGSINLFNYSYGGQVGPFIWASSPVGSENQKKTSNLLFEAGTSLSGLHSWQVQLPAGVAFSVVLK